MAETGTLVSFVEIVGGLVDVAARRSDGSDMNALRWRTRGLLDPPKGPRGAVERERASIDLEYGYWDAAISYLLLPAARDGVLAVLHADCDEDGPERVSEDPWVLLQPDKRRAWERAREAKIMRALQAATRACRKYERPSHGLPPGRGVRARFGNPVRARTTVPRAAEGCLAAAGRSTWTRASGGAPAFCLLVPRHDDAGGHRTGCREDRSHVGGSRDGTRANTLARDLGGRTR